MARTPRSRVSAHATRRHRIDPYRRRDVCAAGRRRQAGGTRRRGGRRRCGSALFLFVPPRRPVRDAPRRPRGHPTGTAAVPGWPPHVPCRAGHPPTAGSNRCVGVAGAAACRYPPASPTPLGALPRRHRADRHGLRSRALLGWRPRQVRATRGRAAVATSTSAAAGGRRVGPVWPPLHGPPAAAATACAGAVAGSTYTAGTTEGHVWQLTAALQTSGGVRASAPAVADEAVVASSTTRPPPRRRRRGRRRVVDGGGHHQRAAPSTAPRAAGAHRAVPLVRPAAPTAAARLAAGAAARVWPHPPCRPSHPAGAATPSAARRPRGGGGAGPPRRATARADPAGASTADGGARHQKTKKQKKERRGGADPTRGHARSCVRPSLSHRRAPPHSLVGRPPRGARAPPDSG